MSKGTTEGRRRSRVLFTERSLTTRRCRVRQTRTLYFRGKPSQTRRTSGVSGATDTPRVIGRQFAPLVSSGSATSRTAEAYGEADDTIG